MESVTVGSKPDPCIVGVQGGKFESPGAGMRMMLSRDEWAKCWGGLGCH